LEGSSHDLIAVLSWHLLGETKEKNSQHPLQMINLKIPIFFDRPDMLEILVITAKKGGKS
jgi:hypothetical protein